MDNLTLADLNRSMESLRRDFPELTAQADLMSACSTKGIEYAALLDFVNSLVMRGAFDGVTKLRRREASHGPSH